MDKLKFYVPLYRNGKLVFYNIFQHSGVQWALSMYRTGEFDKMYPNPDEKKERWCHFVFGDFWSRSEYEMIIHEWIGDAEQKIDVFDLCIKPNEQLLKEMIDTVDVKECKKFLREWYRRQREHGIYNYR